MTYTVFGAMEYFCGFSSKIFKKADSGNNLCSIACPQPPVLHKNATDRCVCTCVYVWCVYYVRACTCMCVTCGYVISADCALIIGCGSKDESFLSLSFTMHTQSSLYMC